MALLLKSTRKKWMTLLGYKYCKSGILKMQKDYFMRKSDCDGIYGKDTDKLLRHLHHVFVYTKHDNFKPEEFRCPCGHCTGYPTWMRANELKHIQTIRSHYGKPMEITSGLRCEYENNRLSGSSKKSGHLSGKAVDFVTRGVTDTLEARRRTIKFLKKLKNHKFSYGDGIAVEGSGTPYYKFAPSMGNAMHTEVR